MRIAYILPMTWTCGGIIAAFHQVNELARRGHDLAVYAPEGSAAGWFNLTVPLRTLPQAPDTNPRFDAVVHVGDTFLDPGRLEARARFILLQGKDHLRLPRARRPQFLRALSESPFHILAVSSWLADFVAKECGNPRVTRVGNGVDPARFFPDPAPRKGIRILIEGNFPGPEKNVLEALEIAARLRQFHQAEVWALGKRFQSPAGLVDRTFEDPPQEDIPGVYRQCDLLIKTTVVEGFGLPHLEGMASGCVPAAYAAGGVLDFCRHDENSLLAGIGNLPVLVWNVLRFMEDSALRARLKAGALATARDWTWSAVADRLETVFLQEAGGQP